MDRIPYIVDYQHPTGTNRLWYRIYSDGWIEQGGYVATPTNTGTDVTLPKEMANSQYFVQVTNLHTNTDATANRMSRGWPVSATKIHVISYTSATGVSNTPLNWEVKGLVKNIPPFFK